MHFYRRWQPVAAISFDLDDTLYDNGPAIVRAEQWMLSHLRSEYLATAMLDKPRWLELKRAVLLAKPELRHDVSLARQQTIRAAMVEGGMADQQASREAEQVFAAFLAERSKIEVSESTHQLLARLGEFHHFGLPLLVGMSRKSMVGQLLNVGPSERLNGSLACAVIAAMQGAQIIRVHDVKETVEALRVVEATLAAKGKKRYE